jgi:hypothetical protein
MALKLPSQSLLDELAALIAYWGTRGTWVCRLFSNNVTPSTATVLSSFVEANWLGYVAVNLPAWGAPAFVAPDALSTAANPVSFTNQSSGPGILYGYYLTDGSGKYGWAERDPNAPVTLTPGQTYSITLRRAHRNQGD